MKPATFTHDEVCAVQYARRMLAQKMPDQDSIAKSFTSQQLRLLNSALAKMEDACDA